NARPKPLSLYIFSKNHYPINNILQATSSGGCCVNDCLVQMGNPHLPFGGINHSGMGKYHGYAGFKCFSHEKAFMQQLTGFNITKMLYPPYSLRKQRIMEWLMRVI